MLLNIFARSEKYLDQKLLHLMPLISVVWLGGFFKYLSFQCLNFTSPFQADIYKFYYHMYFYMNGGKKHFISKSCPSIRIRLASNDNAFFIENFIKSDARLFLPHQFHFLFLTYKTFGRISHGLWNEHLENHKRKFFG